MYTIHTISVNKAFSHSQGASEVTLLHTKIFTYQATKTGSHSE